MTVFCKLIFDLALFEMVEAVFLSFLFDTGPAVGAALFAAVGAVFFAMAEDAAKKKRKRRRMTFLIAGFIIAVSGLALPMSLPERLAALLPVIYLTVLSFARATKMDYHEGKERFRRGFYSLILIPVFALLGWNSFSLAMTLTIPWILFYMVCGFLFLRISRENENGSKSPALVRREILEILIFTGICLLLAATGAVNALSVGIRIFWQEVVQPFLSIVLGAVTYGVVYVIGALIRWLMSFRQTVETDSGEMRFAIEQEMQEDLGYQMEQWHPFSDRTVVIWAVIFAILGVALLAFLFYRLAGRRESVGSEDDVTETREDIEGETRRRTAPAFMKQGNDAVRDSFYRFCQYMKKKDVKTSASDTSKELAKKGKEALPSKSEQIDSLRNLYLSARYDDGYQSSKKEKKEASGLLKEIMRQ